MIPRSPYFVASARAQSDQSTWNGLIYVCCCDKNFWAAWRRFKLLTLDVFPLCVPLSPEHRFCVQQKSVLLPRALCES
jgi:hypothetical protein